MIYDIQDAVPKELIEKIKTQCGAIADTDKRTFKRTYNRSGDTVDFHNHDVLKELDTEVSKFVSQYTSEVVAPLYKPSFDIGDSGYEYHRYNIGDQCFSHADGEIVFKPNNNVSFLRFATMVIHLNTVEEGGITVFPNQNKSFKTIEGQVLLFPPYNTYPHYVTPSTTPREILMTWFVYNGINVIKT